MHETCIDGGFCDITLEKDYPKDSPVVKEGVFSEVRRHLLERGLLDRAPAYVRNSCEWMRRIRKFTFEKVRSSRRTVGYDFLGDINTHWHTFGYSVGMMDEFYRLKPGETVENVLRYNSAAVVLCDLGSDFNFTAGETRKVAFSVSNYDAPAPGAKLSVALTDEKGAEVWSAESAAQDVANGTLSKLDASTLSSHTKLFLEVFGSLQVEEKIMTFPVTRSKALTTFNDVIKIHKTLSNIGVDNISFILTFVFFLHHRKKNIKTK